MATTKVKGSAAGQYLGYALQPVRLFYHLLTCPSDASVGLEHVDDVSVHQDNNVVVAEQCKSALTGNPISNWSVDFWKTLANWLENVEQGVFDLSKTQFRLYVVPKKKPGFASHFSDITTDTEIDAALDDVRKKRKLLKKTPACEEYLLKILNGNPKVVRRIIQAFGLIIEDSDPTNSIHEYLDATVRDDIRETAIKFGIGDAKKSIDEAIRKRQPALIDAGQFRNRFIDFVSNHDSERFLHSLSETPADEVVASTVSSAPCFIRQLDLVGADIDQKTRAASDFLLATGDRTRWAEEGLVFDGTMKEYDRNLLRNYGYLRPELELSFPTLSAEQRGLMLYLKCCNSTQMPLGRRVVPKHFMPGSYNNLSERREIGWHADFDCLLDEEA